MGRTVPMRSRGAKASRAGRYIDFIERTFRVPSGHNYGQPMRLHGYQREQLEAVLASKVHNAGVQIPRGNAKSTLTAAVGLAALVLEEDAPQIPLVAANAQQAIRTLFTPIEQLVRSSPIEDAVRIYRGSTNMRIANPANGGQLFTLPARPDRLLGLIPTLTIIDEAEAVPDDVAWSLRQGAGKRPESLTMVLGTPGPNLDSALYRTRALAKAGGEMVWIEYAAPEDCDIDDEAAWRKANPALDAGILDIGVLREECHAAQLGMPGVEAAFRMYRLGQWIRAAAGWLPVGAWDACLRQEPPPAGSPVVLALDGTHTRSLALVGSTLDGAVFLCWAVEGGNDRELTEALNLALDRWDVVELAHFARIRTEVMREASERGIRTYAWQGTTADDVTSSNELYRAIIEGNLAHDHHPLLAEHMGNVRALVTRDGLRLQRPTEPGRWIDAAMAARMAWWRATQGQTDGPRILSL